MLSASSSRLSGSMAWRGCHGLSSMTSRAIWSRVFVSTVLLLFGRFGKSSKVIVEGRCPYISHRTQDKPRFSWTSSRQSAQPITTLRYKNAAAYSNGLMKGDDLPDGNILVREVGIVGVSPNKTPAT